MIVAKREKIHHATYVVVHVNNLGVKTIIEPGELGLHDMEGLLKAAP